MIFRKAAQNDIENVAQIYSDVILGEEKGQAFTGWQRDVYPVKATAEKALERQDLFVAEDDSGIVATAIINKIQVDVYEGAPWSYNAPENEVMVLHTLAVSPKHFGKGIGRKFVEFYEQYALSNGCRYLRMDTNANNTKARAMYKKLGYKEIGIVDCIFNGIKGVGLVLLEKTLI